MSTISHSDLSGCPLATTSDDPTRCVSTVQPMPEDRCSSSPAANSKGSGDRLILQLAFTNREAVRNSLNRNNLFPVSLMPGTLVSKKVKPAGKLIRSRLAKSLTQALANLS